MRYTVALHGMHFATDISHPPNPDKMTAISQTTYSNVFSGMRNVVFLFKCHVPKDPIDNKPALVQVMASRRTGDKPLPEAILTQFIDAPRGDESLISSLISPRLGYTNNDGDGIIGKARIVMTVCSWMSTSLIENKHRVTFKPSSLHTSICLSSEH